MSYTIKLFTVLKVSHCLRIECDRSEPLRGFTLLMLNSLLLLINKMNTLVYAFTYHFNGTTTTHITASNMLEAFMKFREHMEEHVYTLLKIELIGEALSDV